jgi:hypothetical protein
MSGRAALLSIAIPLALTACYGAAPPKPATIPLPPLSAGATIEVESADVTKYEQVNREAKTCANGGGDCITTQYQTTEPVTRTVSRASYAGKPISYGQLRVMSDSERDQKLAQLDRLSHVCRRANVPRYVGIGLLLGGVVVTGLTQSTPVRAIGLGAAGLGVTSYALGYVAFGGAQCNQARRLYQEVDVSQEAGWHEVTGEHYAKAMREMAGRFNMAAPAPSPVATPATSSPASADAGLGPEAGSGATPN